jgi:TldD protein
VSGPGLTGGCAGVLDQELVEKTLAAALRSGVDLAEVFVEDRSGSSAHLDDGRIEQLNSGRDKGAGIRVVAGETTGFAHTSDLTPAGLQAAAEAAASAARSGGGGTREVDVAPSSAPSVTTTETYPETVAKARKVELLQRANDAARSTGDGVKQVSVAYADSRRRILVANSDGLYTEDDQVRTRFMVSTVAMGDGGMQTAFSSIGQTMGFELFDRNDIESIARGAGRTALTKLQAQPAPSGPMPVVMKHGAGGVLFHEACGHGLEADLIAKGASAFAGLKGTQVASPLVTLVDDGTVGPEWGAFAVDDEGHQSKRNTLIENGVLSDYMWDYLRAQKEGREYSGNGRRQSYKHLPMVRMTNTFLTNGDTDPEEIIRQTERGVYVAQLGGGNVNTATGDFVFSVTEAYLIENGEITSPLRECNLMGNGPEVLRNIDVVGNDFAWGWPGTCGKNGQSVPVGQGQPTLRVATGLTIGGTAA